MYKYKSLKAGQLPQEHLSFLQNLLNFIITKYVEKEFDDDITGGVDERSPCGLSVTRGIKFINVTWSKGNGITTPNREVPCQLLSQICFYCPNLITIAPL